ncbi:MAG: hypothetical protein LBQ02_02655 [Candidatus Nomurabacteria bacterium]|jgi:amino acid transporter|nr:hypothetical protein [Candidatus Nomurabacteria bacterium]
MAIYFFPIALVIGAVIAMIYRAKSKWKEDFGAIFVGSVGFLVALLYCVTLVAVSFVFLHLDTPSDEEATEIVGSTKTQIYEIEEGVFVLKVSGYFDFPQYVMYTDSLLTKVEIVGLDKAEIDEGWEGTPCIEVVTRRYPASNKHYWLIFSPFYEDVYIRVPAGSVVAGHRSPRYMPN